MALDRALHDTRPIGSKGASLTRLSRAGFDADQPAMPAFTVSILLAGRSRPWRDVGDGPRLPRGAEEFGHLGAGILTPHGTAVAWRVEGEHRCAVLAIPVDAAAGPLDEVLPGGLGALYRLTDEVVRDPLLPLLARRLWDEPEDACGRLLGDSALAALLAVLARHALAAGRGPTPGPPARERLAPWAARRAKGVLEANLAGDPTLEEVAAAVGLSQHHFLRAFKATTGQTPFGWLRARRLEVAARLLAETDLPLAELALEVGFKTQSHFTAAFRQALGLPPGRFRREARG